MGQKRSRKISLRRIESFKSNSKCNIFFDNTKTFLFKNPNNSQIQRS